MRATLVVAAAALSVGCSGPSPWLFDHPPEGLAPAASSPLDYASAVVARAGGDVRCSDGSGVTIPAAALASDVSITVEEESDAPAPSVGKAAGPTLLLGPEGQKFEQPVTVTLKVDASELAAGESVSDLVVFTAPKGSASFSPLATTVVDATHVSAKTTHFSYFVPVSGVSGLHKQASDALDHMLLSYWSQGHDYLVDTPGGGTTAGYWIFAQSFDALLDGVERTGGEHYQGLIRTFYDAQNARGWYSQGGRRPSVGDHFDDENWMALALIRAYDLTGDKTYLTQAETLYADISSAWDDTCCGSHPGGIWWDRAHTEKATASNAGPVITGARLAERTGKESYLSFAKKVYAFWASHMVDPTTHHVFDNITSSGDIRRWTYTYNEGLFIGATVELAKATHEPSMLADAAPVAAYMLSNETTAGKLGLALSDGTNSQCTGDRAEFKGIGFRYLASFCKADSSASSSARALLASSAASVWQLARNASTGRFAPDWTGPSESSPQLEADSSATTALGVFAGMSAPYVRDGSKNKILQAEEASIHGVGLEASNKGFSGWGYVAGFGQEGQSVTFAFDAPAGTVALDFRYAAGHGKASRKVSVDGHTETLEFASTGHWGDYRSVTLKATLPKGGSHSVTVAFDRGDGGYLNLDQLTVSSVAAPPPQTLACGRLEPGQGLVAAEEVTSCNRGFWLALQPDGKLIETQLDVGELWEVDGVAGDRLDMQTDGNLVLYSGNKASWATMTNGHPGAYLSLGDDGSLRIYDGSTVLWMH